MYRRSTVCTKILWTSLKTRFIRLFWNSRERNYDMIYRAEKNSKTPLLVRDESLFRCGFSSEMTENRFIHLNKLLNAVDCVHNRGIGVHV